MAETDTVLPVDPAGYSLWFARAPFDLPQSVRSYIPDDQGEDDKL